MKTAIIMQPVESSQLAALGHCAETNTLAIRFASKTGPGSLYHYSNFTFDDFAAFLAAESLGSFFGKHIKPFAEKYPFERIDEAELTRLQGLADQHLADNRTNTFPMAEGSAPLLASLAATAGDAEPWPDAAEILDCLVEGLGIDRKHAVDAIKRCAINGDLTQMEQAA